jgi:hypothetical protein
MTAPQSVGRIASTAGETICSIAFILATCFGINGGGSSILVTAAIHNSALLAEVFRLTTRSASMGAKQEFTAARGSFETLVAPTAAIAKALRMPSKLAEYRSGVRSTSGIKEPRSARVAPAAEITSRSQLKSAKRRGSLRTAFSTRSTNRIRTPDSAPNHRALHYRSGLETAHRRDHRSPPDRHLKSSHCFRLSVASFNAQPGRGRNPARDQTNIGNRTSQKGRTPFAQAKQILRAGRDETTDVGGPVSNFLRRCISTFRICQPQRGGFEVLP